MYFRKKHSVYWVQYHPWFTVSTGDPGTYTLQIRGNYCNQADICRLLATYASKKTIAL